MFGLETAALGEAKRAQSDSVDFVGSFCYDVQIRPSSSVPDDLKLQEPMHYKRIESRHSTDMMT